MSYDSIAVFIDAENFPYTLIDEAFAQILRLGRISRALAYGDFSNPSLRRYKAAVQRYNITAMQIFSRTNGKNSADIALAMDAVEIAAARRHDAFVIVSSDSDFNRLAQKLRDSGLVVIGVAKDASNAGAYDQMIVVSKAPEIGVPAPNLAHTQVAPTSLTPIVVATAAVSNGLSRNKRRKNRQRQLAQSEAANLAALQEELTLSDEIMASEKTAVEPENLEPAELNLAEPSTEPEVAVQPAKKPRASRKKAENLTPKDEPAASEESEPKTKTTRAKKEPAETSEPEKPAKKSRISKAKAKTADEQELVKFETKADTTEPETPKAEQKSASKSAKKSTKSSAASKAAKTAEISEPAVSEPAQKTNKSNLAKKAQKSEPELTQKAAATEPAAAKKTAKQPKSKQPKWFKNDGLDSVRATLLEFWLQNNGISADGFIHCSLFGSAVRDGQIELNLKELGFTRLGKLFDTFAADGFVEQKLDGSAPKFRIKEL